MTTIIRNLHPEHPSPIDTRKPMCDLAVSLSVRHGILDRKMPVLDVGCRNPYKGLWRALYEINWQGAYVGLDATLPRDAVEAWQSKQDADPNGHGIILRTHPILDGELPLPPTDRHPFKEVGVAFCVNTDLSETLITDLKRVAAQITVVGTATEQQLTTWDFQIVGYDERKSPPICWGIWLDEKAESRKRQKNLRPNTTVGHFATGNGTYGRKLGLCKTCQKPDLSGQSSFTCVHCGAPNRIAT